MKRTSSQRKNILPTTEYILYIRGRVARALLYRTIHGVIQLNDRLVGTFKIVRCALLMIDIISRLVAEYLTKIIYSFYDTARQRKLPSVRA